MNSTTAPSTAVAQAQPIVCAAIATLRAITAQLDAMTAGDHRLTLPNYQLSQVGVQAWLTAERGRHLLATSGNHDSMGCVYTRVISPPPTGASESTLSRQHQAIVAIHRQLVELVNVSANGDHSADISGSESLLVFVHEVGALSLELASHA